MAAYLAIRVAFSTTYPRWGITALFIAATIGAGVSNSKGAAVVAAKCSLPFSQLARASCRGRAEFEIAWLTKVSNFAVVAINFFIAKARAVIAAGTRAAYRTATATESVPRLGTGIGTGSHNSKLITTDSIS